MRMLRSGEHACCIAVYRIAVVVCATSVSTFANSAALLLPRLGHPMILLIGPGNVHAHMCVNPTWLSVHLS